MSTTFFKMSLPGQTQINDDQAQMQDHPIHREAQAMELRSRFKYVYAQPPYPIQPGDLCVEKEGVHRYSNAPVFVFIRMLDPINPQDASIAERFLQHHPSERLDCMVGYLSDTGATVILEPHVLRFLRFYDPAIDEEPKR